jgi:hypothetical protein
MKAQLEQTKKCSEAILISICFCLVGDVMGKPLSAKEAV